MPKYKVIYIDPPWSYRDKAKAGDRGAECKYPCLKLEEIQSLDIMSLADKDCVLFLWATSPLLQEAFATIKAWGFRFKTVGFAWIKLNKDGTPKKGLGHYTRSNMEQCLIAVRGKPQRVNKGVGQIIMSQPGQHSEKPSEVRDRIVQLYGDVARIEIFARQQTPGWDVMGETLDGLDIRETLRKGY